MIALAVLVIAISALAIWGAGRIAIDRAIAKARRDAAASAALHGALLRSELQKYRLVPLALADDPDAAAALAHPDPARLTAFSRRLERLSDAIHAAAIYLVAADGTTIAASNWNQPDSFVGSNYSFRAYFRRALTSGAHEQFALGTVSRHPGLYIARRVEADGATGVIVLKVEFDALEREWRRSGEPAFVTDDRGIVLVSSRADWRFLTLHPIPEAERRAIRANLDFGAAPLALLPLREGKTAGEPIVRLGPDRFVEAVAPTTKPGWTLHLLAPIDEAVAAAATSARLVVALLCALLIGGALLIARRRRNIRQRAADAEAQRIALEAEVEARTRDVRHANDRLRREMADRLASEARLQETRDQLVQANKLASLGQIAAGVAHEIAQPVAAIRSYADNGRALLDRGRSDDAGGNLDAIVSMTERIGTITGELRSFSRKARGTVGPVVLADAIDGALLLLRDRIARQNVQVAYDPDRSITVLAERVRLEQVLMNVLGNALDALRDTPEPAISIAVEAEDERVAVRIANNGPPLAPEIAANLFKPFSTSKDAGVGLGLVISRDIARDVGGDLSFEPADGRVAFRIDLVRA
jgi:two-component system C4-dicarboxylate transport sensor histidine kinase DctB